MWDHLVQDADLTKDNFGSVSGSPELMDINAVSGGGGPGGPSGDWFHVNGVDYNPTLDQLVFTSRYANEFFIIDHSTTTLQAAGHIGGNSGKGGDFLYRWGNPENYGSATPQIIPAAVHDPRWIKDGRPDAGYIQFFNNNGGGFNTSTVDAINPPLSGFNYTSLALPAAYDFRHTTLVYSSGQSASDRMTNGNVFVNVSNKYMYEVDSLGNTVWLYNQGPAKAFRYECDYAGLAVLLGNNHCSLSTDVKGFSELTLKIFPNPSKGIFNIVGLSEITSSYLVNIYDTFGKEVLKVNNTSRLDLSNYDNGVYIIHITSESGERIIEKVSVIK